MKFFKDISFWCIVLGVVVIMVVHHILSHKSDIIEGQVDGPDTENTETEEEDEDLSLTNETGSGNMVELSLAVVQRVGADAEMNVVPTSDANFDADGISSSVVGEVVEDPVPATDLQQPETPAAVTGTGVGGVGAKRARMAELAELIASGQATEADNIEIEQLETELAEADDGEAATGAGGDDDFDNPLLTPDEGGVVPTVCPKTPKGEQSDHDLAKDASPLHVDGYFNASCNDSGARLDYCRFVEDGTPDSNRMWLSCRSPLEKTDGNVSLCNSPTPLPGVATTGYTWWSHQLPDDITGHLNDDNLNDDKKEKQRKLAEWFENNCQRGNKCPMTEGYPITPDPGEPGGDGTGLLGHANYIRGFFNASCNEDGQANDYCRFFGYPNEDGNQGDSDRGVYLTCISSMSPRRGRGGEGGCNNKFPGPDEKYGWSLDDIDEDAKKEIPINNPLTLAQREEIEHARIALEQFFTKECERVPCSGSLADHPGGCGGVSGECSNYYQVDADGKYKQCYLGEGNICQAQTDNTCAI